LQTLLDDLFSALLGDTVRAVSKSAVSQARVRRQLACPVGVNYLDRLTDM
jgi:hypothetical protein